MNAAPIAEILAASLPDLMLITGPGAAGYDVLGVLPAVVAQARSPEQVASVLALAEQHGWKLAPRGGGTMLDLGRRPARLDVVLDLSRLNAIVDYQPDDLTLTVQAGVTWAQIEQVLAERQQLLPLDVPLPSVATVGGALACDVSGYRRQQYGTARDLVIGMQTAQPLDGLVRSGGKVVKNVAGYDLAKLHIGGLGTVGIITEVTFKLQPAPAERNGVLAAFPSLSDAFTVARQLLRGRLFPAAVELFGPAGMHFQLDGEERRAEAGSWWLAVLCAGVPEAVARQRRETMALCTASGARVVEALLDLHRERLFAKSRDFGRADERAAALIAQANVLPAQTAQACELLVSFDDLVGSNAAVLARPGSGIAIACWTTPRAGAIAELVQRARLRLGELGGNLTVQRLPIALAAKVDVWGIGGPDLALMRRMKLTFDPHSTLNPGRFVAGL